MELIGVLQPLLQRINDIVEDKYREIRSIERLKYNVTIPSHKSTDTSCNLPHKDIYGGKIGDFITCLYFPEDTDGDFFYFLDEKSHRIPPKKNRVVIIDSDLLHAGNNPRKYERRHAVNIIYELTPSKTEET